MIRPIQSPQNESFKIWKQLSTSKGIRKNECFFLMGEKLIREFLKKPDYEILAEVMGPDHRSLLSGREYDRIPRYQLTKPLFDEVDSVGTHFNLLLLKLPKFSKEELTHPQGLEWILPLGDPGNLGAAVRSAYAFDLKKIHLTSEAALPFHPKAIKASAGASLKIQWNLVSTLSETLNSLNSTNAFVLDQGGKDLGKTSWPKNLFLIVGEEGPGLPAHQLPVFSIPITNVESLNAAVAVSIASFAYRQKNH